MTTLHHTIAHLNEFQLPAAQDVFGPKFILAGPGAGKTNLIVSRAAYMIEAMNIDPKEMLLFTFTKKAATEMKDRVQKKVGPKAYDMTVSTYHAFCSKMLRQYIQYLGYEQNFTIYDSDDQVNIIKKLDKLKLLKPNEVLSRISKIKNKGLTPSQAVQAAEAEGLQTKKYVADLYQRYQKELKDTNAVDFDDLILKTIQVLRTVPEVKAEVNKKYKYLFCDETQDSSSRDFDLIQLLAGELENVCMIADDDQSIYSFRGADISEVLALKARFPKLVIYQLRQNYRSTKTIVKAARSLIAHNEQSYEKELFTENENGEKILFVKANTQQQESSYISALIGALTTPGTYKHSDIAILYRMNYLSRSLEEQFLQRQIPYRVVGGVPFYKRREIKDVLSYIRLAYNPLDVEAFKRAIGAPKRGVGEKSMDAIVDEVRALESDFIRGLQAVPLKGKAKKGVAEFYREMLVFKSRIAGMTPKEAVSHVLHAMKYRKYLEDLDEPDLEDRMKNLTELLNIAASYETTQDFLENLSLNVQDLDENVDAVQMMTLHASKGLEFPVVIMVGMNDGTLPSFRSLDSQAGVEEERRLCYVGMTRAEKLLIMTRPESTMVQGRMQHQNESRFIAEIEPEYIQFK